MPVAALPTCVLCHSTIETVDQLFLHCSYSRKFWDYFINLIKLLEPPSLVSDLWVAWRWTVQPSFRIFGDLLAKTFVWIIWLARNDILFNANVVPVHILIIKIDHLLLSWYSNCAEGDKGKLDEAMESVPSKSEVFGTLFWGEFWGSFGRGGACSVEDLVY